ncbi:MAG: ceramidase domain-containing protein [Cytophaga sp.]|uniref:ceramidase domain-containing protein n=1 Tax=Cytophaga sp. TaxID=29535 RepID=UPI003F80379E
MKTTGATIEILLAGITLVTGILVFSLVPAIPQDQHYHAFANEQSIASIPNFYNVVSNAGFILSGIWGLGLLQKRHLSPMSFLMLIGMILTGLGSAYYHYEPNNETLLWDRLPMTLVFTSFFAEIYARYFGTRQAMRVWIGALVTGIVSVFYWQYTELHGCGDLRLYALVQFLPVLLIAVICFSHGKMNKYMHTPLAIIFICYLVAKFFEHHDHTVFAETQWISGHPIKHVLASFATAGIVWMIKRIPKQKSS